MTTLRTMIGNAVEAQLHLEIKIDGASVDPVRLFGDASRADLKRAWQRAVEAIPERVAMREWEMEDQRSGQ